ncbi:MAG TPA: hypothetical protein VLA34_04780, partial [Candidatus Krumholzibacterium sp.]|nr:hypothetical protein [Candidatus Krumholzibacterium sp.]
EGTTGLVCSSGSVAFIKNIIYRCATGVSCTGGSVISDCNDLWENTLDHSGCAQGATDLFVMPMFCYEAGGSPGPYYLHIDSPCWSTNNTCGVSIGAFTTTYGCTGVATEESTWGRIKQLYSE